MNKLKLLFFQKITDRYLFEHSVQEHLFRFFYLSQRSLFRYCRPWNSWFWQCRWLVGSIRLIPEKLDPDEYLRKYGNDSFNELIFHGRETVFTFKSRYLKQDKNLENEKDKIQYLEEVSRELSQVVSPIEQDMYLSQLAVSFSLLPSVK